MAHSVHSKEEAIAFIHTLSATQLREGVLIWSPHRERTVRKERGRRLNYQVWPESLATRAQNVITHLRKKFGAEIGLEMACKRLETAHPEEKEQEEA